MSAVVLLLRVDRQKKGATLLGDLQDCEDVYKRLVPTQKEWILAEKAYPMRCIQSRHPTAGEVIGRGWVTIQMDRTYTVIFSHH
jgi:hypothetical protein